MSRESLSPEERALQLEHTIDPGFVNHRLCETVLGPSGIDILNKIIRQQPEMPEWMLCTRIGHIYTRVMLDFCRISKVPTLGQIIAQRKGRIFCSTERLGPCPAVYEDERLTSDWIPRGEVEVSVKLEYSKDHITSDTLRSQLAEGDEFSIIAILDRFESGTLYFHPLIIGAPWLHTEDPKWQEKVVWWSHEFFEHFVEDFDEFSKVLEYPKPTDILPMKQVSEAAFKVFLASLLGDSVSKDWGGETSDYFTAHLHLQGRRVSAAFLLKGPAWFSPMTLNHLGKNNDQIYRLSQEPVDVLVLQHCHEITPAVRATLRAFAVQPSNPRRYSLIDGRDSLWLLQAYGFYERSVELTNAKEVD